MLDTLVGKGADTGFWEWEHDRNGPFRWTKRRFALTDPDNSCRFARLELASPLPGNWLTIDEGGIAVGIEWEEFMRNSGPARYEEPLCSEPWKTAYLLDRGIKAAQS